MAGRSLTVGSSLSSLLQLSKFFISGTTRAICSSERTLTANVGFCIGVGMLGITSWKVKSKKAQESRAKLPYNHTGGSRSFASRMSLMMTQNADQAPLITQFFHNTHYRQKSNEWVNEVAQQRHEALV
ncbi:hypothetical protein AAC387_Pa11g1099 [Persea americana]